MTHALRSQKASFHALSDAIGHVTDAIDIITALEQTTSRHIPHVLTDLYATRKRLNSELHDTMERIWRLTTHNNLNPQRQSDHI